MNLQSTALLVVLALLAVFDMVTYAADAKTPTSTEGSSSKGVSTYSALGALIATVLANLL